MKALSLLQPWATLVVTGIKHIETRSWSTRYRGPLLIHASKGKSGKIFADEPRFKRYIPDFSQLPFGYIIGRVMLIDIIKIDTATLSASDKLFNGLRPEEKAFGDYKEGRYAWILQEPVAFKTLHEAKGSLMLWEFDENSLPDFGL